MPEDQDQLYSGITETLKKHGIGLPAVPTAKPVSEITVPEPRAGGGDQLLSGIQDTLKKHGIAIPGAPTAQAQPATVQLPQPTAITAAAPEGLEKPVVTAPPKRAAEPEIVPGGFGGEIKKPLPEAIAPSPQPVTGPVKGSEEPSWAIQALASVTKFPAEIMHGFLRGGEQLLDIPRRIIQNDWESPTPKTISPWAGKAAEAAKALEPKEMNATKFVGNLLGGLAGFAIPGFATAAAGYELPFLGATLLQRFGSNLLTFGFANSMSVKGAGGSDEDSKRAMINTIPTAALFTVAQSIPFDKLLQSPGFVNTLKATVGKLGLPAEEIAKSPWLSKIMEMGATGTAFAGSEAIEGQRDPASLAVSFLTGAGVHLVMGGLPQKRMKIDWEGTEKAHGDFNRYVSEWKETNRVNEEQFAAVKAILDAIKQEPIREVEPSKPILDQFGKPVGTDKVQTTLSDPETQAALAKPSWERNAHEKFLADQVEKQAKESLQPPAQTPTSGTADIIPGTASRERANVTEPSVDRLQRAVDVVGDSDAGKKLGDLLAGNQEDLANAFRAPGEAPGVPEITDKIVDLAQKVEDTGDPNAAKELHDFINSNLGALKGLPRWPVASTQPITPGPMPGAGGVRETGTTPSPATEGGRPAAATEMVSKGLPSVNPAGRSNEVPESLPKEAPPAGPRFSEPAANEPPSGAHAQPGGAGNVGISPTPAEAPKKRGALVAPKPGLPDQPMGQSGRAAMVAPEVQAQAPTSDPLQAAKDFVKTRGTAGRVGVPKEVMSKEARVARASERGDLRSVIRELGGIRSDSKILQNFEKEERLKLIGLLKKDGMGPDVMADTINKEHSHMGGFEDDAHLIRTLVDGSYKKLLNKNTLAEEERYHDDHIAREAESGRVSEVDLSEAERIAEREVEAEEIAGRSAKPGEYDLDAGWPTTEEPPSLSAGAPKANRLETRLDQIQADYPGADRDRVAQVIRALPNAEDGQVVNMAADPEMFAQVARGNLKASEKAQLLKKASDAGAQGDLFGGGERGGDTLFKVGATTPVTPDTPLFHGQSEPFEGVKAGNRTAWWEGRGFYLTNDPDYARA